MAEMKLKDFVDEDSAKKLVELDNTLQEVGKTFAAVARDLSKGLEIDVKMKGDADKLGAILAEQSKVAAAASGTLTDALKKQMAVAEQLIENMRKKAKDESLDIKQQKELAKASTELAKTMTQNAKAEEAIHRAEKAASTVKRNMVLTEKERQKIIKDALVLADQEVHSIAEANEANKRLREAVKLVRDTDKDYQETLGKLNSTIGVNTDMVKRNSDRYTQQKMTVGDYKEQVKRAWMEINTSNSKMKNMGIIANGVSGIFRTKLSSGIREVTSGVADMAMGFVGAQGVLMGIRKLIASFRSGVGTVIDFEAANSKLAAVLGMTADGIVDLTTDAIRLGASTKYTASQVTELQIELAKLGFTREEIRQSTEAVLKFSQATGAELGEAAALSGAALRMFGATTKETERYVSAMAVSTARSALSFQYLATAMPIVGPVAKSFNFTIEDTLALVGKLADAGFDASMSATAARNILLNLADANGKLAKSLGKPVVSISDLVSGLVELRERGVDLNTTLELTDKRSVAAFNAFLTAAEGVGLLREQVTGVEKELDGMAETMANNVQGALAGASSAWESLVLAFYKSKGMMKEVIDLFSTATRNYAYMLKSWEDLQSETDNASSTRAAKELKDSDALEKHTANMKRLYEEYVKAGMSVDEAQQRAKSEYLESLKSRLEIENGEYKSAIEKRKQLEDEYNNRSFWTTLTSWKRTGNVIKDEIETAMYKAAGKKGLASITESIITDLEKLELVQKKSDKEPLKIISDEQKRAIVSAESALQESKAKLMEEGYEKEVASIRAGYEKRINAVKGGNEAELQLRASLQQEMEKAVSDFTERYTLARSKENLENKLASVEKESEEELAIRLQLLEIEKSEEIKAAEAAGTEISLIREKFERKRASMLSEYAQIDIDNLSKNAAAEQMMRTENYKNELRDLERHFSEGLMLREDYERRKAEITESYAVGTARAAVELLEKQLAVADLNPEQHKTLTEELQKAKSELATQEADAEIEAIKRVEKYEKDSYKRRISQAQQWLDVVGSAFEKISGLASTLLEADIRRVEQQQDANDESYGKEIDRIEQMEEQKVITKEQAEARKRAAEERTAKRNKELEEQKQKLMQKQAKWDKANSIVQAGIATALAITRALPNLVLAAIVGAMGAVQIATIAAAPIPAYAKGTKRGGHAGGLALVGDGGQSEVVVYRGKSWITPDKPTVVNLPRGAEVIPSIEKYVGHVPLSHSSEAGNNITVNTDFGKLENKIDKTNYLLSRIMSGKRQSDADFDFELYVKRFS